MTGNTLAHPEIVSPDEWQVAIDQLLVKEKELTRLRDALNAERRRLPMVKIDTEPYVWQRRHNDYECPG